MASARVDDGKTLGFDISDALPAAGMSSRSSLFSKVDPACHPAPSASILYDNGLLMKLGHSMEKLSGEQQEGPGETPKPKQGTLMKKLGWLISPKKKASKSSSRKHVSPPQQDGGRNRKDHLELLFAHAEATLGELHVRAGAPQSARSLSQEEHRPPWHHPQNPQSNSHESSASVKHGGSFGRITAESPPQGHSRGNSLSRIWQQVGGSLFCGSAHMNTLAMEEMELRGMAPMLQAPSTTCFGENFDGDMAADEIYWQSLAESILRQKTMDADQQRFDRLDEAEDTPLKGCMAETSLDIAATSVPTHQCMRIAAGDVSGECLVTEILSEASGAEAPDAQEIVVMRCTTCGTAECSLEDEHDEFLLPTREVGHGCTRLNTMLDSSPNLAHNYHLHMKSRADSGAMSSGSGSGSSKSVVELLNYYSRPSTLVSMSDEVMMPLSLHVAASSSGAACASGSNGERTNQRRKSSDWNETKSELLADTAPSDVPNSADSTAQNPPEPATNSIRVSLMTLLHEEAAGVVESEEASVVDAHGAQAQAMATQDEEGLAGEEPLALYCCVCMVRRKGAALIPCGHTFCRICSKQLFADRGACPLCNNLIVQLLDIF